MGLGPLPWAQRRLGVAAGSDLEDQVGHIYAQKYSRGPGRKGFAFIYFLPSGMRPTQKVPRRPRQVPGQFPNCLDLEVIQKNISDRFYK